MGGSRSLSENRMKKFLAPVLTITIVAAIAAAAYWKWSNPLADVAPAPDTYLVWSVTRDTTVDGDGPRLCDAFVYRYAVGAEAVVQLDRSEARDGDCDAPYGFDAEGKYVFAGARKAVNLNGRDVTAQTDLGGKRGVEGYWNEKLGIGVYDEYVASENRTYVHFYGSENAPDGFEIDNAKIVSSPYYLGLPTMSDDGSQLYFEEFTEASGSSRFGIHVHVYDVRTGSFSDIAYGKDLLVDDVAFDYANRRLLVVSGTRGVNEEAPGWDGVTGPSKLHLVDLTTGEGVALGIETADDSMLFGPRFSPVDPNVVSVASNGVTSVMTVDGDGLVVDAVDLEGLIADWSADVLVMNFQSEWDVYGADGKTRLGTVPFAAFDMRDGSFGIQYLGSTVIPAL